MTTHHINRNRSEAGNAFIFTMCTIAILSIIIGGLVEYAGTENIQARRQNDSTRAFLIACSAMQKIKADLNDPANTNSFAWYFMTAPSGTYMGDKQYPSRCDFFRSTNLLSGGAGIRYDNVTYQVPTTMNMGSELGTNYPVSCTLVATRGHTDDLNNLYGKGEVIIRVSASYPSTNGVSRTITETTRFGTAPHKVFDYAYFINNFGWMYGSAIRLNGDVRSNRNFSFSSNPRLNGDVYASLDSSGSYGRVNGTYVSDNLTTWYNRTDTRTRAGNPAAPGGANYAPGYNGSPTMYESQTELTMPYIKDLGGYKQLVADETTAGTGTATAVADVTSYEATLISSPVTTDANGHTIVDPAAKDRPFLAFWDSTANSYRRVQVFDNSSSRNTNVAAIKHAGVLMISGDDTHPIVINGPVVVMGDVVLKGKYVGQGTIFANRNVHIVDNLQSKTPPNFFGTGGTTATDTAPLDTFATNKSKDLIGLVARGNVILGNYTLSSFTTSTTYMKPSFTAPYIIDAGDADNGYSNTTISGQAAFDGNYTNNDGGRKNQTSGASTTSGSSDRKYYQSTLADSVFNSFSVADNVNLTRIDAVMYNNHLFGGRMGDTIINGTCVARDEACVFTGNIRFNYDERIHSTHGEDRLKVFLPYQLMKPFTIAWREGS